MHLHYFKIDENERRTRSGVFHHLRQFWHVYRGKRSDDDGRTLFEGHVETIVVKPKPEFSARFHVGNAGSETPFDGHMLILGTGIYWGLGAGRKLAQRITTSKAHKYDGRDLSLRIFDGKMWVSLWVPNDRSTRREFPRWRDFSVRLNIADVIYGPKRYAYETLDSALIAIDMPEGTYPVAATLQLQRFGRAKSKRKVESFAVDVEAPKGIPSHYDSSGGWKGDRTYGFGISLRTRRDDWSADAKNAITAWVFNERAKTGFRVAQVEVTR